MITSQLQIFPLQLNCWSRIWRWWVLGASFWMWSSPRSSAPVWTGCKQILSWRQSPWGSTCGSPWSISDWKTHKNTQSEFKRHVFSYPCFFKIYILMCSMSSYEPKKRLNHLGNMWPVSLTSLQGMWCLTSGLLIHVWMFTISFRSSSDIEELSISSGRTTHAAHFIP